MGSSTPAEFVRKLDRAAHAVETAQRDAVNAGAEVVSDVMHRGAQSSIGGPTLAGARWGTRVRKASSNTNPQALASYRGPVHWFEKGTGAHTVVSRKVGGSRTTRGDFDVGPGMFDNRDQGAILTPAGPRAYANPRGMRARPFWAKTKEAARRPGATEVHRTLIEKPLRSIF